MDRFGIGDDTTVIIYDNEGGLWAARLWWALRYYGHEQVKLLNGGLTQWIAQEKPLETEAPQVEPAVFHANTQANWLATIDQVKSAIDDPEVVILDALMQPNYNGNLHAYDQPGHIPTALSLPAPDTIDPMLKTILPPEDLSQILMRLKLDQRSAPSPIAAEDILAHMPLLFSI